MKQNIIKEIAQELDYGNDCYFKLKTDEIIAIPNFRNICEEEELKKCFKDDLKTVRKNIADSIKIEVLESFESFKIMEGFLEEISDHNFRVALEDILQRKKPFQNFKHAIDNSDFRQKWFDFKITELEKLVEIRMNYLEAEPSRYQNKRN